MDLRSGKAAAVGSTHRIQNLSQLFHNNRPSIDLYRTRVFTKIFQETEGEPLLTRRYKAYSEYYSTVEPIIYDNERIVGWQGAKPRSAQIFIDHMASWLNDEEMGALSTRIYDPFEISNEDLEELREVHLPYWREKSALIQWKRQVKNAELFMTSGIVDMVNFASNPATHFIPDYETLFRDGLKGRVALAEECLAKVDTSDPGDLGKEEFYEGIIAVMKSVRTMWEHYATKAQAMAEAETRPAGAQELRKIAETCRFVPWNPPRDFYEAIQMVWMTELVELMEACGTGPALGRLDQILYPYYRQGIQDGSLTPEKAMEYIEELYIKCTQIPWLSTAAQSHWSGGYYRFINFSIGGIDEMGNDASNELTYLFLRAFHDVRTIGPTVQLMLHAKTPDSVLLEAVKLSAEGMGHPAYFNVETIHRMLEYRGGGVNGHSPYTLEQIRKYGCLIGCVHPGMMGLQYGHLDSAIVNLAAILTVVLHNGKKPLGVPGFGAGQLVGLETGDPRDFQAYEEFEAAVKKQMKYFITQAHAAAIKAEKYWPSSTPSPCLPRLPRAASKRAGTSPWARPTAMWDPPTVAWSGGPCELHGGDQEVGLRGQDADYGPSHPGDGRGL